MTSFKNLPNAQELMQRYLLNDDLPAMYNGYDAWDDATDEEREEALRGVSFTGYITDSNWPLTEISWKDAVAFAAEHVDNEIYGNHDDDTQVTFGMRDGSVLESSDFDWTEYKTYPVVRSRQAYIPGLGRTHFKARDIEFIIYTTACSAEASVRTENARKRLLEYVGGTYYRYGEFVE